MPLLVNLVLQHCLYVVQLIGVGATVFSGGRGFFRQTLSIEAGTLPGRRYGFNIGGAGSGARKF
jgi:hypothetical protein